MQQDPHQYASEAAGSYPPGSVGFVLVEALAAYLRNTLDREDIRRAIRAWREDSVKLGAEPQAILIHFKAVLGRPEADRRSATFDHRLAGRRELILMSIDEELASEQPTLPPYPGP